MKISIDDDIAIGLILLALAILTFTIIGYLYGAYSYSQIVCSYNGLTYGLVRQNEIWCIKDNYTMIKMAGEI